jgi:dTDP-4-amino-4,6-dideoxy-D-glucose acyltransferase
MSGPASYLSPDEVVRLGLASCGEDVRISRMASIYCPEQVHVGSHVRIDDFVVLTSGPEAEVRLGDHVHIAAHAALFGGGGITVEDYVTVSGRCSVYSVTDDYGGEVMTNPTVPEEFTRVVREHVTLRRHVVVGAASVILPGVEVGEGSTTGAMTLVNRSLEPWGIYVGIPARRLCARSRDLLSLEAALEARNGRP